MTIAVLGAGMVGSAIANDLAAEHKVTSFDVNENNLKQIQQRNSSIHTKQADLSSYSNYNDWLQPFEIVVTAVPGFMGYKVLEAVINAGKNLVDISFFGEDALQLDKLAKERGVTAITDCGVAPGVSNFIIGRCNEEMKVSSFECYVGGLPVERKQPFQYKAPFSPVDVIQEYIRPARLVEKGNIVTRPALSEREIISFEEVGELEAFNTDGLRSLIFTMKHIPEMKEKTLRYPGHVDLIIALKKAGMFNTSPINIAGVQISPLEFISKMLIKEWKLGSEEEDFTVMKVIVKGWQKEKAKTIHYNLIDRYDPVTKTSSMARTTGYTCTAAVNLLAKNLFNKKGVFPPELIGSNEVCFDFVMNYLGKRNVIWKKSVL